MLELLGEYMFLRQLVTPVVCLFWVFSKKYRYEVFSLIFVLTFSMGLLFVYPKLEVAVLWFVYCYAMFLYGEYVSGDHVFAACYAVSSAHFGGWLYEVPFWHPSSMFFSTRYPWLVNMQIVSGLFCLYLLAEKKIKINRNMIYAAALYAVLSVFYAVKPDHRVFMAVSLWWLPRVGVMVLLWSALTGIEQALNT